LASVRGSGGVSGELRTGVRLSDEQRLDWLQLIRTENIGPRGIRAQLHQIVDVGGKRCF